MYNVYIFYFALTGQEIILSAQRVDGGCKSTAIYNFTLPRASDRTKTSRKDGHLPLQRNEWILSMYQWEWYRGSMLSSPLFQEMRAFLFFPNFNIKRCSMKNFEKYTRQFFIPPKTEMKWTQKNYIEKAPAWCSVDLRDGNQSLIVPMSLDEKLEFFKLLVEIGFKEIEVGFPAASETEYAFLRAIIERNMIPDDVTIQVLTQSREHIIKRTFEALDGCKNAVVHLYNSTSYAQRTQVFRKSREEIIKIALEGATLFDKIAKESGVNYTYEYSPESFTGT